MSDPDTCCTPTSPQAQAATNSAGPNSTEGHKNPEWTPKPKVFGAGANVE